MTTLLRDVLRLTILLRPACLLLLIAFYVAPLVQHGWRTSWDRGPDVVEADAQREAALRQAGYAAHAAPVYFQAALYAPLKWLGSDRCYVELTNFQIRGIKDATFK